MKSFEKQTLCYGVNDGKLTFKIDISCVAYENFEIQDKVLYSLVNILPELINKLVEEAKIDENR